MREKSEEKLHGRLEILLFLKRVESIRFREMVVSETVIR